MSSLPSSAPSSILPPPSSSVAASSVAVVPSTSTAPPSVSTPASTSTSLSSSTSEPPPSSTTSTPPPSTTPPTSPTSTTTPTTTFAPSFSPSTFLSVSNGNTIVVTTIVRSTPSSTGAVTSNSNSSKGFFENTGAVAGTFSVVGLIGLGILIFIVTAVIRRRRAERFDKDVALAAAEAAATAHSPDFDDYGYSSNGHGAGTYGYTDTFHQDPVKYAPTREAYGMSDVGGVAYPDPDNYSIGTAGGPGAAGIGAGALFRSKSGRDQQDPFNAYVVHQDPVMQQNQASMRQRAPTQGRRDGPSIAGGGYDAARNVSRPDNGVVRNKSIQSNNRASSPGSHYSTDPLTHDPHAQPPPLPESYLDHYRVDSGPERHQLQARPPSAVSSTDIYGGIAPAKPLAQQQPASREPGSTGYIPNPFASKTAGDRPISGVSEYSEGIHPGFGHDDSRMSLRDDEDYGAGRRVLKVANE